MNFRLLRMLAAAFGVYFLLRVAFPEAGGKLYHAVSIPVLVGAAVGVQVLIKVIEFNSKMACLALELGFVLGASAYLGFSMPQAGRKPPFLQLLEGERPVQSTARKGFERMGLDADDFPWKNVVRMFPKG